MKKILSLGRIGIHWFALRTNLHRWLNTCEPHGSLRAARAGEQAHLHFGLAHLEFAVGRHTIVASQSQLHAAAKRKAIERGRHGLCKGALAELFSRMAASL